MNLNQFIIINLSFDAWNDAIPQIPGSRILLWYRRNRFWKVLSDVCGEEVPETKKDKITFALRNHIADGMQSQAVRLGKSNIRETWRVILVSEADIFLSESLRILAERLSQSEIGLPLRQICYYSPPEEVGVFSTEIKVI